MKTNLLICLLVLACFGSGYAQGDQKLRLAGVFTDHMVLQRNMPLRMYGTAASGAHITVHFSDHEQKTIVTPEGKWEIVFMPMPHGGPYEMTVETPQEKVIIKDILVGDVWICAGQSNMDFQLQNAETGSRELAGKISNPNIRFLKMNTLAETGNFPWDTVTLEKTNQLQFFSGSWQRCDQENAGSFSAVGYYFGKTIAASEHVPIGLIQVSVGGSPTESWIDKQSMQQDRLLVPMLDNWQSSDMVMPWCRERAAMNVKNAKSAGQRHPYEPGYNFQAGISPFIRFPVKGVIWYQGESNAHNIGLHAHLFEKLVKSWREKWGYEFPFYYVQLSGIDRPSWPDFRDSQRKMLAKIPNSGMAVSYDLGDSLNVHPLKKQEIGERLARLALYNTYKKKVVPNGPVLRSVQKKGNKILIDFSSAGHLSTKAHEPLTGFELVTDTAKRLTTDAVIQNNRVHITIPAGEKIKSVCYAYQPFTRANLINDAGLPASTFIVPIP